MTTLSDKIRSARYGAVANPYQGKDKKVLFVCSMGILRSATGSRIYGHKYNTRCAGTYDEALIPVTQMLLEWANEIVYVQKHNYDHVAAVYGNIYDHKTKVIDIPDNYEHMHDEIIKAYQEQYEPISSPALYALGESSE